MLSKEDNEKLTRVGPGSPMGELMRRYWIPAAFSDQVALKDGPPVRVRLLGEDLVLFRDSDGRLGLLDEYCPHRTASLFFGRNEEAGLRCAYHGIKFDVAGNCLDVPCVVNASGDQLASIKKQLRTRSYPCEEHGGLVWTYMGTAEQKPGFPELEWTQVPAAHRFATRHIQQCNWLQGVEGGFDPTHLAFLHSGVVDLRKGKTDSDRKVVAGRYEIFPTESGFLSGSGRDLGDGTTSWHVEIFMVPFHKIIPSVPLAAHVWAPMDDENTMLYSINFDPHKPFTNEVLERELNWRGIHTENIPGTDHAVANKDNNYLIDRPLQSSGHSFTGLKGLGVQDCAMQESMGPVANRAKENLLPCDAAIVRIRRMLQDCARKNEEGGGPAGLDPASYRMRAARFKAPSDASLEELIFARTRVGANEPAPA